MANLVIVCGPQAVGKMTVAESLRDKLRYNMMMNHDSIEMSDKIFGFGTPAQKEFNAIFREKAFELAVKHNVDLIFTYVCAFEVPQEREYLTSLAELFKINGGEFYFVELSADLATRLERNETPHRMECKASKRDVAWSKANLLKDATNHRLNVSAKYSCGFSNPQISSIIVTDRYLDYFTTIMEDRLWQVLARLAFRWWNRSDLSMNAVRAA